jgi:O-antigen/teichoic acid export membrane protein
MSVMSISALRIRKNLLSPLLAQDLTWDATKYLLSKVVPGICGLLFVALMVRIVGNAEYGRYALFFSLICMAAEFFGGWLRLALLRFYTLCEDALSLRTALSVMVAGSILAGAGFFVIVSAVGLATGYSVGAQAAFVLLFSILILYNTKLSLLQAQIRPGAVAKMEIVRSGLGLLLPACFALLVSSHVSVILGLIGAYAFPLLVVEGEENRRFLAPRIGRPSERTRKILREFWHYGWPLSLWFTLLIGFQFADRYLIKLYCGIAETGKYASMYDIVFRGYSLLLLPVSMAAHPRIMAFWNGNEKKKAIALLKTAFLFKTLIFAVAFSIFFVFAGAFVAWISPGPGRDPSHTTLLLLLAVAGFLWQLALLAAKPLELFGKTRWMLAAVFLALVTKVLADIVYLPVYGILVPAWTTIGGALVYCVICLAAAAYYLRASASPGQKIKP